MKKIITIMISILILSSNLSAKELNMNEVETFVSYSKKIDFVNIKEENEVFFGEYNDYVEKNLEEYKKISEATANGLSSGLASTSNGVASSVGNATGKAVGQGLGMGLGIGLVYGISGSIYQKLTENDVFVLTKDYTDINGNKSRVVALFYAKSFNDKAIIKNLLIEKINKKINKG